MDQRDDERKPGPSGSEVVQHRRWSDNHRRGPRRRLHDRGRCGGADRRVGPISTEWAIHGYPDRHPHQPGARPGTSSPGSAQRPGPKPDHGATAAAGHVHSHPDVHADLHSEFSRAGRAGPCVQLGGAVRVEFSVVVIRFVDDVGTVAKHHPGADRDESATGSVTSSTGNSDSGAS